jgi:NAD(P)-dependent dehydrogenase (short-subunit alcohol dehydrogenase family)
MKVAITGHTRGIGLEFRKLYPDGPNFSRSNGFDITYLHAHKRIVEMSADSDIFINNAHMGFSQVSILFKLWDLWQDLDKIIICISSDAADYSQAGPRPYTIQKRALEDACLQLHHSGKSCKVMCLKPGYIDTTMVSHITKNKMDPADMVSFVKGLVDMNRTFWVPMITLYPK